MNRLFLSLLCAVLLLTSSLTHAQGSLPGPAYYWGQGVATHPASPLAPMSVEATATAVAPNGHVYTAYSFVHKVEYNGQTYALLPTGTAPPNHDRGTLVAHYDAQGQPVGRPLVYGRNVYVTAMQVDASGNIYVAGAFAHDVVIGSDTVLSPSIFSSDGPFVAKISPVGALVWCKAGVATQSNWAYSAYGTQLTVDAAGHVTFAARLVGRLEIGGVTLDAVGQQLTYIPSTYVMQFDGTTGAVRWAHITANQTAALQIASMAVDPASGTLTLVLVAGEYMAADTATAFTWNGQTVGNTHDGVNWLQLDGATGALRRMFSFRQYLFSSTPPRVAAAENGATYLTFSREQGPDTVRFNGAPVRIGWTSPASPNSPIGASVLARLDATGHLQWVRVGRWDSTSTPIAALATTPWRLAPRGGAGGVSTDDVVIISGSYTALGTPHPLSVLGSPLPWPTSPFSPAISVQQGFVAAYDGLTGQPRWTRVVKGHGIPAGSSFAVQNVTQLDMAADGRIVLGGTSTTDSVQLGSIQLPLSGAAFTSVLLPAYNQVTGAVFSDANANGQPDPAESGFAGLIVQTQPDNLTFSTEPNGSYSAITELGTQTVTLPAPPRYHTLAAPPASATFTSFGNVAAGRHFALQPIPNQQDLQVYVTPVQRARPGFTVRYQVSYRNIGTTTTSGTVTVQLDSRLTYLGNNAGGTLAGNTLTVAYASLAPFTIRSFEIQFQVPTTVAAGTDLLTIATVEPVSTDQTPADNTETNSLTVTSSFDPNDIQVNRVILTPQQVTAGEWLEYTIRFENTGTDTAFTVMLRDALPLEQLDLATLQFVTSSHSCIWRLAPSGLLTVQLPNIRLPYRNINALRSMGFVRFRARSRSTLALGDVVPNAARIHFDYNAPVPTNTALTTVQLASGLPAAPNAAALTAWPNPTTGLLNVALTSNPAPAEPLTLTLLDNVGRAVLTHSAASPTTTLDVRHLPAGLYLLRGQQAGQSFTHRVVIR